MPQVDRSPAFARAEWRTITGPMAWCDRCPFVYHGDTDNGARRAISAARKHTLQTGHETIVERGQSMRIRAPERGSRS